MDRAEIGAEEERVTAETYGALDASAVNDECWMIRVPPKLTQLFEQCPEGTELGELVFTKGGTANGRTVKPSLTVHLSESLVEEHERKEKPAVAVGAGKVKSGGAAVPLNYSLEAMTKKIPVMHPFVRNPKNGSCKLLGKVSRTANLQVKKDDSYRALLKDRLVASNVNSSRYVKPADQIITQRQQASAVTSQQQTKRGFGNAVYEFGKRKIEATNRSLGGDVAQPLKKKARQFAPDQPVRSVMFDLFGAQRYWAVKDLKAAAMAGGYIMDKRREKEMGNILRDIGEYHRSGDHKFKWELRKEFQQAAAVEAQGGDAKRAAT